MHPKISFWLEKSTAILQDRILHNSKDANSFTKELNKRRAMIGEVKNLFPKVHPRAIAGSYQIIGANSETAEKGYVGVLSLKYEENRIFATWLIEGADVQTGFGLLHQNVLSINFTYEQEGTEYTGLVSYEFLSNEILSGFWVEEGTDEVGVEFGRKLPLETGDPLQFFGFN